MYEVNGFIFESEELAKKAQKEADAIKYIKTQTKMDDPDMVLDLYNKLLQKKMLETPVGISFLKELQEYLQTIPYVKNEDIRGIPVRKQIEKASKKKEPSQKVKVVVKDDGYKKKFHISVTIIVICICIIVGMFVITYFSGNNVNIINYENEIINKYESWEEQLNSREAEIKAREAELEKEAENGEN